MGLSAAVWHIAFIRADKVIYLGVFHLLKWRNVSVSACKRGENISLCQRVPADSFLHVLPDAFDLVGGGGTYGRG